MSKARILAVDDQQYFRDLVEGLLRDEGFEVRKAGSGEEALQCLEQQDFEIVLADLVMPGVEGADLVRKIRERVPEQDIVVLTGLVDVRTAVEAMKLGATGLLLKPFDRGMLVDSIEKVLERRRLQREHGRLMAENLEYMGMLSLFERAAGLFGILAIEPLTERLVEGLCLETGAQSVVAWVADSLESPTLELAAARGPVRVEDEPPSVRFEELAGGLCPSLLTDRSARVTGSSPAEASEALYLPLRFGSEVVGLVRLADKLGSKAFTTTDRASSEKLCELGAIGIRNALRFQDLERRSLCDPETHVYTQAYFDDAVRNEIRKANRFGHRFSILRVRLDESGSPGSRIDEVTAAVDRRTKAFAERVASALRSADLLASSDPRTYSILLPQTDALGAGILAQRIRHAMARLDMSDTPQAALGAVLATTTYPVDGTHFESLLEVLEGREESARQSLLRERPELMRPQPLDRLLDRMLELGSVEPVEVEGQVLRFVLEDVVRRPADRGVLFLSPGARWLPDVLETLDETRGRGCRTEIVLLAEVDEPSSAPNLTWVTKSSLDPRRPFLVYFGDGPAFAMVGQVTLAEACAPLFQTADRALVEHLAFELQRELEILISV